MVSTPSTLTAKRFATAYGSSAVVTRRWSSSWSASESRRASSIGNATEGMGALGPEADSRLVPRRTPASVRGRSGSASPHVNGGRGRWVGCATRRGAPALDGNCALVGEPVISGLDKITPRSPRFPSRSPRRSNAPNTRFAAANRRGGGCPRPRRSGGGGSAPADSPPIARTPGFRWSGRSATLQGAAGYGCSGASRYSTSALCTVACASANAWR